MAVTPTATGYHAPLKVDPVEPALGTAAASTDPTDVALLARSIETAHARCKVAAGSATSMAAGATRALQMGTISGTNVSGEYTRITSGTGHAIQVTAGGTYRVTGTVIVSGGTGGTFQVGPVVLGVPSSNGLIGSLTPDTGIDTLSTSRVTSVSAGGSIDVTCKQTGGSGYSATLIELTIERVGP